MQAKDSPRSIIFLWLSLCQFMLLSSHLAGVGGKKPSEDHFLHTLCTYIAGCCLLLPLPFFRIAKQLSADSAPKDWFGFQIGIRHFLWIGPGIEISFASQRKRKSLVKKLSNLSKARCISQIIELWKWSCKMECQVIILGKGNLKWISEVLGKLRGNIKFSHLIVPRAPC